MRIDRNEKDDEVVDQTIIEELIAVATLRAIFRKFRSRMPQDTLFMNEDACHAEEVSEVMIYMGAPLFNEMERARNAHIASVLESEGFAVYLPQRDGGVSYDAIRLGGDKSVIRRTIFEKDVEAIKKCDVMLCLLDGRVPDEGMCIELGIAFSLGKLCLGFKTDERAMDRNGDNNIMLDGCLTAGIVSSVKDLVQTLTSIALKLNEDRNNISDVRP